jgi:hypothetical protein
MQKVKMTLDGNHLWSTDKVLLESGLATRVAETRLIDNGQKTVVTFESRHPLTVRQCENMELRYGDTLLDLSFV